MERLNVLKFNVAMVFVIRNGINNNDINNSFIFIAIKIKNT